VFSPSLALAEMIERGNIEMASKTCETLMTKPDKCISNLSSGIELGAGTGLVSFVAALSKRPPRLLVLTDYPDQTILGNLKSNIERNKHLFPDDCQVVMEGYNWGTATDRLR
jgi:EEF1A N-terminal glycine/lysine methyltransferase